jgi:ABC-2 type transport system ATP-binding protein
MSIKVRSLVKKYGSQKAVDGLSFSINKGEVAGFLGPNGSGKSTTMKCMCGILPFDEGTIEVDGRNILEDLIAVKGIIGYLPENNPLHPEMYVREYLSHIDGFYNKSKGRKQRVDNIVEMTGLAREQHKNIGQLSKGYRQRVGLAQAIIHNPSILILDEPTSGLDPNQILEIRELISGLAREKTVLLSTHILQEVEAICDRVIVINQGRIVADGTSDSIRKGHTESNQIIYLEFGNPVDISLLEKIEGVISVKKVSETEMLVEGNPKNDLRSVLFRFASENNFSLLTIQQKEQTLENIFRDLTGKS